MKMKGSISIEAALSMTIFMTFILFVGSFLLSVITEFSVQLKINEISRELGKQKMYVAMASEITDQNKNIKAYKDKVSKKALEICDKNLNDDMKEFLKSNGFGLYLKNRMSLQDNNENILKVRHMDFSKSSMEDGVVDVVGKYTLKLPYFWGDIDVLQRCKIKDWTGVDITKKDEYVYVTKTASVYHKSINCTHINLNISECDYQEAINGNNMFLKKYSKCAICCKGNKKSGIVFVAEHGDCYHSSLDCPGLTRFVEKVPLSQVKDKKPCSRCGG